MGAIVLLAVLAGIAYLAFRPELAFGPERRDVPAPGDRRPEPDPSQPQRVVDASRCAAAPRRSQTGKSKYNLPSAY